MVSPPPPGWLPHPPHDRWLGRSASALTKRTCFSPRSWKRASSSCHGPVPLVLRGFLPLWAFLNCFCILEVTWRYHWKTKSNSGTHRMDFHSHSLFLPRGWKSCHGRGQHNTEKVQISDGLPGTWLIIYALQFCTLTVIAPGASRQST